MQGSESDFITIQCEVYSQSQLPSPANDPFQPSLIWTFERAHNITLASTSSVTQLISLLDQQFNPTYVLEIKYAVCPNLPNCSQIGQHDIIGTIIPHPFVTGTVHDVFVKESKRLRVYICSRNEVRFNIGTFVVGAPCDKPGSDCFFSVCALSKDPALNRIPSQEWIRSLIRQLGAPVPYRGSFTYHNHIHSCINVTSRTPTGTTSILAPSQITILRQYCDTMYISYFPPQPPTPSQTKSHVLPSLAPPIHDFKLTLSETELASLVGDSCVDTLKEAFGSPRYDEIVLRRTWFPRTPKVKAKESAIMNGGIHEVGSEATVTWKETTVPNISVDVDDNGGHNLQGNCNFHIDFHLDHSEKTMHVSLNSETESLQIGGRTVYIVAKPRDRDQDQDESELELEMVAVDRCLGSYTVHDKYVVHGVEEVGSGYDVPARYALFLLQHHSHEQP